MKARRVVAPSLFPYTSSQLNSSNPTLPAAHYTIHSTSTPKTWPNILSLSVLFLFCAEIQLQKDCVMRFKTDECVGDVAEHPQGFLSLHLPTNPPKAAVFMFHSSPFFIYLIFVFLSSLVVPFWRGRRNGSTEFPGVIKVCCSFFHMPLFSLSLSLCCKHPPFASIIQF